MPRGVGQGPIVVDQFLGLEAAEVRRDHDGAVHGILVNDVDPFQGSRQAGIAHADHDLGVARGDTDRMLNQLDVRAVRKELHLAHGTRHEQSLDSRLPLICQVGFQPLHVERLIFLERRNGGRDDKRCLGCHFGHVGFNPSCSECLRRLGNLSIEQRPLLTNGD